MVFCEAFLITCSKLITLIRKKKIILLEITRLDLGTHTLKSRTQMSLPSTEMQKESHTRIDYLSGIVLNTNAKHLNRISRILHQHVWNNSKRQRAVISTNANNIRHSIRSELLASEVIELHHETSNFPLNPNPPRKLNHHSIHMLHCTT